MKYALSICALALVAVSLGGCLSTSQDAVIASAICQGVIGGTQVGVTVTTDLNTAQKVQQNAAMAQKTATDACPQIVNTVNAVGAVIAAGK